VRERLGDPRVVPSFRCSFLPDMPSSMTPGSSASNLSSYTRCRHGLRRDLSGSALPNIPQSVSRGARISWLHWFASATACQVARSPLTDQTGASPATGSFYSQAFNRSVALPVAGYNYDIDWTPTSAGLSPAGMAASFAAPEPYVRLSRIRLPPRVCDGKAFCTFRMRSSACDTLMRL
jgi:hypothetical protein